MLTAAEVKEYIMQGLACDYVQVQGNDGQHFEAVIVSPQFAGKNMVQQHQLVYQALKGRMGNELHALALQTSVPTGA